MQETADPTALQENADLILPVKIPDDITASDQRITLSMTKDIAEDMHELVKDSEDVEEPSLEVRTNEEQPAAKKGDVSFIGPVEPPRPTMIRWAMGT